jgi:hypothetical protein
VVHQATPSCVTAEEIVFQSTKLMSVGVEKVSEPESSWIALMAALGPEYRSMARMADVQIVPHVPE